MDFTLTDEQQLLQDTVRSFAAEELVDTARQVEDDDEPPARDIVKRYAEALDRSQRAAE